MTVHILSQYQWPDCSPTARYADSLGVCLQQNGYEVKIVGCTGAYRHGSRPKPDLSISHLPSYQGRRGNLFSTAREYLSVYSVFKKYILSEVNRDDVVICTSAPPQSIRLIEAISRREAVGIYWLQDYYPELLRALIDYPGVVRNTLSGYWNRKLRQWPLVVKISGNLAYHGTNSIILRNWPLLSLATPQPFIPRTAYYFGNLGYAHCLESLLVACRQLREENYSITLVGDGPKVAQLPSWIDVQKPVDEECLSRMHWQGEIHLVAADPKITGAIFPSKYWNSRLSGRKIITTGFAGSMLEELNEVQSLTRLPSPEDWLPVIKKVIS